MYELHGIKDTGWFTFGHRARIGEPYRILSIVHIFYKKVFSKAAVDSGNEFLPEVVLLVF